MSILRRPLSKLLVSPHSDLGRELGDLVKENAEFSLPPSNNSRGSTDATSIARDVQGMILAETCQLFSDGSCQGMLQTQEGVITFKAGPDYAHILDEDGPIVVTLLGNRVQDFKAAARSGIAIDFKAITQPDSNKPLEEFTDF